MQRALDWKRVMDRNGVPTDSAVRASVISSIRAIMDLPERRIAAGASDIARVLH